MESVLVHNHSASLLILAPVQPTTPKGRELPRTELLPGTNQVPKDVYEAALRSFPSVAWFRTGLLELVEKPIKLKGKAKPMPGSKAEKPSMPVKVPKPSKKAPPPPPSAGEGDSEDDDLPSGQVDQDGVRMPTGVALEEGFDEAPSASVDESEAPDQEDLDAIAVEEDLDQLYELYENTENKVAKDAIEARIAELESED